MAIDLFKENHKLFLESISPVDKAYYQALADGQQPLAMMITCVDSRIMPEQLLGLKAGQLFCLRNIANLVPLKDPATISAIEYAVRHLNIKHIIVMGHSNCGGISALTNNLADSTIAEWLDPWQENASNWLKAEAKDTQTHCQRQAVIDSIRNIEKLSFIDSSIKLHAWHLDIPSARISEYNAQTSVFVEI